MVERVRTQRDVDYVIVHKLDRFARNRADDAMVTLTLEAAGASLVSCSESIDATPGGQLLQGVLAVVNEYHSRNMGEEIRRKRLIKVQEGGTPSVAPLGYKNVGEGGRRFVVIDPEPAELLRWSFKTYAETDLTALSVLEKATAKGLRSKGGPNTPRKPLVLSHFHRILTNPYYKGIVVYNGAEYQGKHDPLIDGETWAKVQDKLRSNARGEKQRTHPHYLKGTIFCGHCGGRLCVSFSRNRHGRIYPYTSVSTASRSARSARSNTGPWQSSSSRSRTSTAASSSRPRVLAIPAAL